MSELSRREMLTLLAAAPLTTAFTLSGAELEAAADHVAGALHNGGYEPESFSPYEWRVVRLLADMIIPVDAEHGGALEAGVPEFLDFTLKDRPQLRVPVRAGLRWVDNETRRRFDTGFADAADAQRRAVLDDIAWPARARPEHAAGVAFFNQFRDLVAGGYFSSRVGVEYLRYAGNRAVREWHGCPPEVLERLGVRYDD